MDPTVNSVELALWLDIFQVLRCQAQAHRNVSESRNKSDPLSRYRRNHEKNELASLSRESPMLTAHREKPESVIVKMIIHNTNQSKRESFIPDRSKVDGSILTRSARQHLQYTCPRRNRSSSPNLLSQHQGAKLKARRTRNNVH